MPSPTEASPLAPRPTPRAASAYWLRLGCVNFGGPAAQISLMHRDLVERRRWIGEREFAQALNYCLLLPGPEAMQLATWCGWRLHGVSGGLVAGTAFFAPAALLLGALSWLYLRHGQAPAMQAALLGIQAAMLAVIARALWSLSRRFLRDWPARGVALAALGALALPRWPFPLVIGLAALAGLAMGAHRGDAGASTAAPASGIDLARPGAASALRWAAGGLAAWWLPLLAVRAWLGADSTAWGMAAFFSKAALLTFGGAYAVLPYVAQSAVDAHGWLQPAQMLAGLGLAESTPGPLIIVLEFVGFVGGWQHPDLASPLASALLCAAVTLWATFLPSFLFVLPAAPWIAGIGQHPRLAAAMRGVGAAVVGAIASLGLWFGVHLLQGGDARRVAFVATVAALVALAEWRLRLGIGVVVLGAALAGVAARAAGWLP